MIGLDIRRFSHRRVLVVIGAVAGTWLVGRFVSCAAASDFVLGFAGLVGLVEVAFGLHACYSDNAKQ